MKSTSGKLGESRTCNDVHRGPQIPDKCKKIKYKKDWKNIGKKGTCENDKHEINIRQTRRK